MLFCQPLKILKSLVKWDIVLFFTLGTFHSGPKDYTDSNYSFCMQQFYKIFSKIVLGGIKTEKVPLAIVLWYWKLYSMNFSEPILEHICNYQILNASLLLYKKWPIENKNQFWFIYLRAFLVLKALHQKTCLVFELKGCIAHRFATNYFSQATPFYYYLF